MVWKNKSHNDLSKTDDRDVYDSDTDFGDIDDIGGTDIKINPDYYIHTALTRAQKCLLKDDLNAGFLSYIFFINHIEHLCIAAKKLDDVYKQRLEVFSSEVFSSSERSSHPLAKEVRIANFKLQLMMEAVFDNKQISEALRTS